MMVEGAFVWVAKQLGYDDVKNYSTKQYTFGKSITVQNLIHP